MLAQKIFQVAVALSSWMGGMISIHAMPPQFPVLANLSDGNYQMCSQPPPQSWQQGAGVCLVFTKQGDRIEGYYGYPHSDAFVCLRGTSRATQVSGQGYLVLWEGAPWEKPTQPLIWDKEQRLRLEQAKLVRSSAKSQSEIERILFQKATLDVRSFYLYNSPKMTSPKQLCNWNFQSTFGFNS
ncbi:MAG: hypothetical protein MUC48_04515 [Leptolyngbya sp. Prado105]|jgi:hypothetical protein|nr:hypothetical protein [Leptolyngbya sp. Prado105]